MSRSNAPESSPEDWRRFLAEPEGQWKTGYSARTLAYCWLAAAGDFPEEVRRVFATSPREVLRTIEPLRIQPEYRVKVAGQGHASQTDVFVLAQAGDGDLVSITVEGKVNETFGSPLGKWKGAKSGFTANKQKRLADLQSNLGLSEFPDDVYYQLVHRMAAAVIEARRFNACYAVMLIHSFSEKASRFRNYARFLELYGVEARLDTLHALGSVGDIQLFAGWVRGEQRFREM